MRNESKSTLAGRCAWMLNLRSDPSMPLLLGFAAFVLAVMLLAFFYVVIQQGVTRGHTQWAKASRVASRCDAVGDNCLLPTTSIKVLQVSSVR